jgi:hypothetical protein
MNFAVLLRTILPGDKFNGIIQGLDILKSQLAPILGRMTRFLIRSRRLMAVSVLLLLAGVVVLSTATRKPCLQVNTAPWRLWKAGHMTKPEGQKIAKLRVMAVVQTPQTAPTELLLPPPSIYLPLDEFVPSAVSIVVQIRHFRAPPTLS